MKGIKNKKLLLFVGILAILGLVARFSYAYFEAQSSAAQIREVEVDTGTVDTLSFHVNKNINVVATQENLARNGENVSDTSTLTATLTPNNTSGNATDKYNLFFVMDQNDLIYTSEEELPELVIRVTDPNGNIVERIANLDGDEGVFDITGKRKAITITTDYQISATNNTPTSQNWTVEVSIVNLNSNQAGNAGRKVSGSLILTKEVLSVYSLPEINNVETIDEHGDSTITNNSIGIKTIVNENTEEIDKYYYAIEEYQEPTAWLNQNGIVRLSNIVKLAVSLSDYTESSSATHTFTNLAGNTKYKVYVYAKDVLGFQSNIYTTILETGDVITPRISGAEITATLTSLTIDITALDGDNEIDKYLYSIDGGKTWIEEENPYIVTDLPATREYDIKVKVVDTEGLESPEHYEQIATKTYIKPEIENVNVTKNANSITLNVISEEGSYEIDHYLYSIDNGTTWEEGTETKTFSGLTGGNTYNIKIKAVDENGRESVNYNLSTKAESYSLPSISEVYVRPFPTTMTINVTAAGGTNPIAKYYYSIQDGRYYVESTNSSYTFEDLASNATYYIKVYVEDSSGKVSPIYETVSKTDYLNPSIRGVYKQENATSVVLTVNVKRGSNEIDGYYYKLSNSNEWIASSNNVITVTGLTSNTPYTFDVKTVDTEGHESEVFTLAAHTLYVDPTVVCSAEAIDYENILVTATVYVGSNPVTGYNFKKGSEAYKGVQQTNTYTFGNLEPGTQYSFSVQVIDSEGHTATNTCRGTTNAAPTPTITFNTDGGSSINSQTVTYKQAYGTLPTTTKDGHTFGGWYKDSGLTNEVTSSTIVTDPNNHTLYAKWTINSYTQTIQVRYENADGTWGSYSTVKTSSVVYGNSYSWSTSEISNFDSTTYQAASVESYTVTGDTTKQVNIYRNIFTCSISYKLQNADGTYATAQTGTSSTLRYGQTCSWSRSADATYQAASYSTTITSNVNQTVSVNRNTFTCKINYQLQNANGTYATAQTGTNSTLRYGETCSWSRSADTTYKAASYSTTITSNVNQTVNVDRNTFTITKRYRLQGTDAAYPSSYTSDGTVTVRYGDSYTYSIAATTSHQAASTTASNVTANATLSLDVPRKTFTVTKQYRLQDTSGNYPSSYTSGGTQTVVYGGSYTYSIAATTSHQAASGSVSNVTSNQTISVNVPRKTFTCSKQYRLENADGTWGSYTADGSVTAYYGGSCSYSKTVTDYKGSSGGTNGSAGSASASNVTANQTLSISMYRNTYTLTVTASTNTSNATGGGAKRWGQSCAVGVTKATNTTCITYATPTWTASTGTAPAAGASSTYTMPKSNATVTATSAASNVSQTITLSKGTGVSGINIGSTNYTGSSASLTCGTYNISGNYSTGYGFSSWSRANGVTVASTSTASTTMTVSGAGTLTLNGNVNTYNLVITGDAGVSAFSVRAGSTSGTVTSCTKSGNNYTCSNLAYGTNYYLYPTLVSDYVFVSYAKTDSATNAQLGSTSAQNTYYKMGAGAGAITITTKKNATLSTAVYLQDVGNCAGTASGTTTTLTDVRDNKTYNVAKIGNYCLMGPLQLAGGTALNSTTTNITSNYTLPASSTSGFNNNNTANMYYNSSQGYSYFSYMAATAGTGGTSKTSGNVSVDICPKNWRMATSTEMYNIQNNGYPLVIGVATGYYYNGQFNNPSNSSGGGSSGSSGSASQNIAMTWTSTVYSSTNAYYVYTRMTVSYVVGQPGSDTTYTTYSNNNAKAYGYPVICITS